MAKLFSTKTHGLLDYATVALLLVLPRAFGWSPGLTRFVQGMGVATALYSLVTGYERGLIKLLPIPAHFALDVLSGISFCGAAAALTDEPIAVRATLAAIGAFEVFAGLSTEPHPSPRRMTNG